MVYYLNNKKQSSASGGNYEVHTAECTHAPLDKSNMIYLGSFKTPREAVMAAKRDHLAMAMDIDGCYFCCRSENKESKEAK